MREFVEGRSRWAQSPALLLAFGVFAAGVMKSTLCFAVEASPHKAVTLPESFSSAEQALRTGIEDLSAGNVASAVRALAYAAQGGQAIACWKLGEMYADGNGVERDDAKAYHYFNQLVEAYDEDAPDARDRPAIANAFVAVGVYSLSGIPGKLAPNLVRAREFFFYAATNFGDPDAEYNLAHMYIDGAGGLAKDNMTAVRWLRLAAGKGHADAQGLLGHMLFVGDQVPRQRANGLMWLQIAKDSALAGAKDDWIREAYKADLASASEEDRQIATAMAAARAKNSPQQIFVSHSGVTMRWTPLVSASRPRQAE